MVVFAPMPSASDSAAMTVKPGAFVSSRAPYFKSWTNVAITHLRRCWRPRGSEGPTRSCRRLVFRPDVLLGVARMGVARMPHAERTPRGASGGVGPKPDAAVGAAKAPPKKAFTAGAWEEARALIWTHR